MFQKPTFGASTSFGSAASSPFSGFKPAATNSAFGAAPAFGTSSTPQASTGGGLFGATNTTGGLFGSSSTPHSTSAFGSNTSGGFGFGQNTSGVFGANTSVFGAAQQPTTSAFGAKPEVGFSFGSTPAAGTSTGGLFGGTTAGTSGLFGQPSTSMGGGGLFGASTSAFGQQQPQQTGTAHAKYNPVIGTDVMVKSGTSQNINIKHHCITCMKEYENKSLEELRLEDYLAGRKGSTNTSMFGGFQAQPDNKPLFGGTTFGQPATTASSMFGTNATNTFGQNNTFSFGATNPSTSTSLFGANKPMFGATSSAGTGLFGTTTTQSAPAFGATNTFGFGANTQNQGSNIFGAKPATTGFGTAAAPTAGFGGFGTSAPSTGLFAAKPATTQASAFGTATSGFGSLGGFGANTSTSGGLFGQNNSFAAKPAQPTFGFGTNTQTSGFGTTAGLNTFQNKPAGSLFSSFPASNTSMFNTTQNTQPLGFGATNTNTLGGGLGGLNFGGGSTLGNTSLGGLGGFGAANNTLNVSNLAGSSANTNVHEQVMSLAARPYGDSPLFKGLMPESNKTTEELLKPTNPAAVKAVLNSSGYRVGSPDTRIKVLPRTCDRNDKKSLFDGLEEADASLEGKLSLKPSRKRLILRPQQNVNSQQGERSLDNSHNNGSLEETSVQSPSNVPEVRSPNPQQVEQRNFDNINRQKNVSYDENLRGVNTDIESSTEKQPNWIGSSRLQWSDKNKSLEIESTPRLYPSLEKEVPVITTLTERRASWLTTKSLRKPLSSTPESIDNSIRELRTDSVRITDKDADDISVSEDENIAPLEVSPHPSGVRLSRPGYYTIPSLDEMINYKKLDGTLVVPNLTIGRKNYGSVTFDGEVDITGLNLDELVQFLNKEIIVYPDDTNKPPVGQGLNKKATVTLDRVWPRDKTEKRAITDPERLIKMDFEGKLRRVCDKHDTSFVEYRPETGSWVFKVKHFSKYGLADSDEDDDVIVSQAPVVNQTLLKSAAPSAPKPLPPSSSSSSLVPIPQGPGLGGLSALVPNEPMFVMQHTSLNLFNGTSKGFDMDTTDDAHGLDPPSLYSESTSTFGVKSPTSDLARLEQRSSHHVQLMKASLYADIEMDDDISISTGDQRVPSPKSSIVVSSVAPADITDESIQTSTTTHHQIAEETVQMKPLIVRPPTIILRYHRKIPPFKHTIAGRLEAACIADMGIARARHLRVGHGPRRSMAIVSSRETIAVPPAVADLGDLDKYLRGRGEEDWSEQVVTKMALARLETNAKLENVAVRYMSSLLSHTTSTADVSGGECPRHMVTDDPAVRLDLLNAFLEESRRCAKERVSLFTVSGEYCHEVWSLCRALWAADLENGGVPGMDELSIVNRYKTLIEWFTAVVTNNTNEDLSKPQTCEPEDETDKHTRVIWLLLLGGRVMEACEVAKKAGDHNLAVLMSQAGSDPIFRNLLSQQLLQWSNCGALPCISTHRLRILRLLSGEATVGDGLADLDWLRAMHATARYLTDPVPTVASIVSKYESFFPAEEQSEPDLSIVIEDQATGMEYPVPTHNNFYDNYIEYENCKKRVLDLRYELIHARATDSRPKLHPEGYTSDQMDYSLSFLLGAWFGHPSPQSIIGMADQLEAHGYWHLAVQTLMHHPDAKLRGRHVRAVLSRNAPAVDDAPLSEVLKLGLPKWWILTARAQRAKYEHLPELQVKHLVEAELWNDAHEVLIDELLPKAVLSNKIEKMAAVLEKMNEAAQRNEVSDWEYGGMGYYMYMLVCTDEACMKNQPLLPRVLSACGDVRATGRMRLAARDHMCRHVLRHTRTEQLAPLLKSLKLPPDCTFYAQQQITNELASQASECCANSTNTSPMSSLHRNIGSVKF